MKIYHSCTKFSIATTFMKQIKGDIKINKQKKTSNEKS